MRPSIVLSTLAASILVSQGWAAEPEASSSPSSPSAVVRALQAAERRTSPSGTAEVRLLAQGQNAFLGRLEMKPHAKVPPHQDPTEEYIHVIEGSGTLWIDGTEHPIEAGSTVFMPAGAKVRFENGPERLVALQVFAGPGPAAKYDRWKHASD